MELMNYKLFACKQKYVDGHAKRCNTRDTGGSFFPPLIYFVENLKRINEILVRSMKYLSVDNYIQLDLKVS